MRILLTITFLLHFLFASAIDVTFEVNMSVQIEKGTFNPSTENVDVAGTFNDWGGRVDWLSQIGDGIYHVTLSGFSVGQQIEFKFRYNGNWDGREEFPGEGNNRMYTVQENNNKISVWYNNEEPDGAAPLAILNLPHSSIFSESTLFFQNRSQGDYSETKWTISKGHITETFDNQNLTYNFKEAGNYKIELEVANAEGQSSSSTASLNVLPRDEGELSWWNHEVFYEIFVRSFQDSDNDGIGDFKGLTEKLDYLNDGHHDIVGDLGVTGIWLMPIHPSTSYHGYDVKDYRDIHPELGSMEDFKEFLTAAQTRGIKVIIDFVMNHSSSDHPWFQSSIDPNSTERDYYVWQDNNPNMSGPWGQKAWHEKDGDFYYAVFWHEMPDINYLNEEVKQEMFDIAEYWLNKIGIVGFRLDAVRYIVEDETGLDDSKGTIQFWKEYNNEVKTLKPEALSIGEAWTNTSAVQDYTRNNALDLCFEFDLSGAIINAVNNNQAEDLLAKISAVNAVYPHQQWATFLSNHDQNRIIESFRGDEQKLKTAAAIQLTLPGVPFIYYGNEIGMKGTKPDEFIRRPMQWDNSTYGGFSESQPWIALNSNFREANVGLQMDRENSLLNHYQEMISLRSSNEALRIGDFEPIITANSNLLVYERETEKQELLLVHNLSNTMQYFEINYGVADLTLEPKKVFNDDSWGFNNGALTIADIPAGETVIIQKRFTTNNNEHFSAEEIKVFPNPASGQLIIDADLRQFDTYRIIDSLGRIYLKGAFSPQPIDISSLSDGIYIIQLDDGNVLKAQGKFIAAK